MEGKLGVGGGADLRVARWTGKTTQATVTGGAGLLGAARDRVNRTFRRKSKTGAGEAAKDDDSLPGDPVLDGGLLD